MEVVAPRLELPVLITQPRVVSMQYLTFWGRVMQQELIVAVTSTANPRLVVDMFGALFRTNGSTDRAFEGFGSRNPQQV